MRPLTLTLTMTALAGAASAQPIMVLNAPSPPRAAPSTSECSPKSSGGEADIECVLSLAPPRRNAAPATPSRILIRAQWAAKPCAPRNAQVVELSRPTGRGAELPVVDQAASGRVCGS